MKFVFAMALLAILCTIAIMPIMISYNESVASILDNSLNLLATAVPPILPAAMTAGIVFTIQRLKKKKIFCISPPRVNVAGRVNMMVFDKTGTLTEEGLEIHGFRHTN